MVAQRLPLCDLFVTTKGAQSLTVAPKAVQITTDFVRTRLAYDLHFEVASTFFDGCKPFRSFNG
jgi:hypothetical protein